MKVAAESVLDAQLVKYANSLADADVFDFGHALLKAKDNGPDNIEFIADNVDYVAFSLGVAAWSDWLFCSSVCTTKNETYDLFFSFWILFTMV